MRCCNEVIENNTDVLLTSEAKLDVSFSSSKFFLNGFTPPYKLDRTQFVRGLMLFMREDITPKLLKADTSFSGLLRTYYLKLIYAPRKGLSQVFIIHI